MTISKIQISEQNPLGFLVIDIYNSWDWDLIYSFSLAQ
jgi:hypothetical protein